MTTEKDLLAMEGVGFFGEMSASISHEIKNVLAIFNENSGLLEDMVSMSEKGMPLSPERLVRLSRSLARNIKRADDIVKRMNRFSHSADESSELVDVQEAIEFIAELGARVIRMKGAQFHMETPSSPVKIRTNRFFLENLVWRCMVRAMETLNLSSTIHILIEKTENGPTIRFVGKPDLEKSSFLNSPTPREQSLLQFLGACLNLKPREGEMVLSFAGG